MFANSEKYEIGRHAKRKLLSFSKSLSRQISVDQTDGEKQVHPLQTETPSANFTVQKEDLTSLILDPQFKLFSRALGPLSIEGHRCWCVTTKCRGNQGLRGVTGGRGPGESLWKCEFYGFSNSVQLSLRAPEEFLKASLGASSLWGRGSLGHMRDASLLVFL